MHQSESHSLRQVIDVVVKKKSWNWLYQESNSGPFGLASIVLTVAAPRSSNYITIGYNVNSVIFNKIGLTVTDFSAKKITITFLIQ